MANRLSEESMSEWTYVSASEILTDRRVKIPGDLMDILLDNDPITGKSVFWNLDQTSEFVILSNQPPNSANTTTITHSTIYVPDDRSSTGYVRIPQALGENVLHKFQEGTTVFFLAREEMLNQDNASVYLLAQSEILNMLPEPSSDLLGTEASDKSAE